MVKGVSEDSGKGLSGMVNGRMIRIGRYAYVTEGEHGVPTNPADVFTTPLAADEMATFVSINGRLAARIVMKDIPRVNAKESLERLRSLGVRRLSMLTGDKAASANIIAKEVGISDVRAELFPEDKLAAVKNASKEEAPEQPWWDRLIQKLTGESITRSITMMVGDGVNDAPVLASADIGMAITDGTSTAASESAQVVIMNDDIACVPHQAHHAAVRGRGPITVDHRDAVRRIQPDSGGGWCLPAGGDRCGEHPVGAYRADRQGLSGISEPYRVILSRTE